MTATDSIVEAESNTATTPKTNGRSSGAASASIRSYTIKFDTVGTYYFYSTAAAATKRVTVTVVNPPAPMMSSTGGSSFAFATAQVSFVAIVLAAIFALVTMRM
jgi:hypothetical protein